MSERLFRLRGPVTEPFGAMRRLLGRAAVVLGDDAVEHAIAPHRALLASSLRNLVPKLTLEEQRIAREHSVTVLAALPNTGVSLRPTIEAWGSVVATLLDRLPYAVLSVPDTAQIDHASLLACRAALARQAPAHRRALVVGHRTDDAGDALARRLNALRAAEVAVLETVPCVSVDRASGVPHGDDDAIHPYDDGLERRLDSSSPGSLVETIFAGHGFAKVVEVARRFDDVADPTIDRLAGLSALFLAAPTGQDELASEARRRLRAALEREPSALVRVLLHYRLSIEAIRRDRDAAASHAHADAADRELDACGAKGSHISFRRAWVCNVRAYALFREGRVGEGRTTVEQGLAHLASVTADDAIPARAITATSFHLNNNLARLYFESGDRRRAHDFQMQADDCLDALPRPYRTFYQWRDVDLDAVDLGRAVVRHTRRAEEAALALDPPAEAEARHAAATALYRAGRAKEAYGAYARTLEILRARATPDELLVPVFNCVAAAMRAGLWEEARLHAEPLLADADAGLASEIAAVLARAAAGAGDMEGAGRWLERARREARADGRTATASCALAAALRSAGQTAAARRAYQRALACSDEDDIGIRTTILAGLVACGDRRKLGDALAACELALDDADVWWELPTLLAAAPAGLAISTTLLDAARQRRDCELGSGR